MPSQRGQIELLVILAIVIGFAFFVSGGLLPNKEPSPITDTVGVSSACCNYSTCTPVTSDPNETLRYPGTTGDLYGLLKSSITLTEGENHLVRRQGTRLDGTGVEVIVNNTDAVEAGGCGGGGRDQMYGSNGCFPVPNDQIIYVCQANCDPLSQNSEYDVYFRLSPTDIVPPEIKNCSVTPITQRVVGQIVTPSPAPNEPYKDLQMKAFQLRQVIEGTTPWLSPWCKPAIYLYPQDKTDVHIVIAPQGKLTLTIPKYPSGGWEVTAFPNGDITYQNHSYDYLYYEAQIPDTLVAKPKEGFVVSYNKLSSLFSTLLPKLGLNEKETSQFSDYWLKSLPKSLYYFVGIVDSANLDSIAPLSINPTPNSTIRVTLYFEALPEKAYVNQPAIIPTSRNGFSVVEWGGILKTDPTHPFSCFM